MNSFFLCVCVCVCVCVVVVGGDDDDDDDNDLTDFLTFYGGSDVLTFSL